MAPPICDSYASPVKSFQPQNVGTAKTSKTTATTALSEHSGYKEPADYDDYMKLKKLSSDAKSHITKLLESGQK
jgi:hypothetical protein